MDSAAEYRNTWLDKLCESSKDRIKTTRYNIARKGLERKLGNALLLSQGYKKQRLARSHALWTTLQDSVKTDIREYCEQWNCSEEDILRDNPGLIDLLYKAPPRTGLKLVLYAVASLITLWLLGALGGLVATGYHFVISHLW